MPSQAWPVIAGAPEAHNRSAACRPNIHPSLLSKPAKPSLAAFNKINLHFHASK